MAFGRLTWRCGVATCFALAATASLVHNERQVLLTKNERGLRQAILADAASQADRGRGLHYLVLLRDEVRWFAVDALSPVYAKTWFPGRQIDFRLVPSAGIYAGLQEGPSVTFLEDAAGVANATLDGRTLPYSQIRIVLAQGDGFTVTNSLQQDDLQGLRAEWQRSSPLTLAPCIPATPACR